MKRLGVCPPVPGAAARALLADDRLVILATEPVGAGASAQCGGVALLDRHGAVLLSTRICPPQPNALRADTPPIEAVWPTLVALLAGRMVASYALERDRRLLRQTARRLGATLLYSEWCSMADLYRQASRRAHRCSFATACRQHQIPIHPTPHALADARATLALLRALALPTALVPSREVFWRYLR